jgi:hypothetical protein
MGIKVANNAFGTLAAGINSSATSITLTTGQGARFPTLGASDYFYATLIDTSNNLEIVKVTARSTDVLTVVRAQESTTARAYSTGDRIEIRLTAATFTDAVDPITALGYTPVNKAGDTASKPIRHSGPNDITNGNLNTLTTGGLYMGYNLSNGPVGAAWASVFVTTNGSDQIFQHHQEAGYDGGLIHVRFSTNGGSTWSSWTQVATPGAVTNGWIPSSGRIMRYRGGFSVGDNNYLNGLDSYWGNDNEGYWTVGRPGYSSTVIVMNCEGSIGTVQWAANYDSAMYRRNRTDNNSWSSWRQQD